MQKNWKSTYLEGRILAATPLELVSMLYEQALMAIDTARDCLQAGEIAGRSGAIMKALAIITELDSSLNHDVGGEVSLNLARLYQYIRERLISANLRQEDAPLMEAHSLLAKVGESWTAIQKSQQATAQLANDETEVEAAGNVVPIRFKAGRHEAYSRVETHRYVA